MMTASDPQLLFVGLVLPSLFALTFVAEGVHKLMSKEPPWVPFVTGFVFLGVTIGAFFLLFS